MSGCLDIQQKGIYYIGVSWHLNRKKLSWLNRMSVSFQLLVSASFAASWPPSSAPSASVSTAPVSTAPPSANDASPCKFYDVSNSLNEPSVQRYTGEKLLILVGKLGYCGATEEMFTVLKWSSLKYVWTKALDFFSGLALFAISFLN
jgi:hypothetical protein